MPDLPKNVSQALERAGAVAEAAVALVDCYPEEYRVPILEWLLRAAGGGGWATRAHAIGNDSGDSTVRDEGEDLGKGLGAAAAEANVNQADLERIVHVGDDGSFRLLLRVEGSSRAERATRAAVIYCFIKEHGFGDRDVETEELRRLCKEQKAYDAANFARNLQKGGSLLLIGEPRSKKRQYRLSPKGEETAKTILQELLGG